MESQLLSRAEQIGVAKYGDFTLSSGLRSKYYVDGRLLSLDGMGSALIGQIINKRLPDGTKSIGGPAIGAIPLVVAIVMTANSQQQDLQGFYVRSSVKEHGRQQLIEGNPVSPAVLVDDTCTTGGSVLQTAAELELRGIKASLIISVFDRGARQNIEEKGYRYSAILCIDNDKLSIY